METTTTRPDLPLATTQDIARATLRNASKAVVDLLVGADALREVLGGTELVAELRTHADALVRATMRLDGRERLEVEALVRLIGDRVTYLELLSKLAHGREQGESTLHVNETTRVLEALAPQ
ncbi:MAG TPA: hypothetical protein VF316_03080 [Polyangiaceae bacterium]